ncbi:MAG: hypothetical protein ACRYGA_05690 [Janthinobacterium lividum]
MRLRRSAVHASIAVLSLITTTVAAQAAPLSVTVDNQTRPTACAEEDNVSLVLSTAAGKSPVARFRVEALPPVYLADVDKDIAAPDFSACDFDGGTHPTDPAFRFAERHVVLYDGPRWRIAGIVLPTFWRPNQVPVKVGLRTERGLHLLQIFAKTPHGGRPMEALVMYPADGYWRIKPLPEARFGDGVYGSSFLMGPVTQDARPVVDIVSIVVTVSPLALRLRFADGSTANVKVEEVSQARTTLDVRLVAGRRSASTVAGSFAVLRSMYVAPDNADMSEVQWTTEDPPVSITHDLPDVTTFRAVDVRFGRSRPSRHNTSAPDIRFGAFDGARVAD